MIDAKTNTTYWEEMLFAEHTDELLNELIRAVPSLATDALLSCFEKCKIYKAIDLMKRRDEMKIDFSRVEGLLLRKGVTGSINLSELLNSDGSDPLVDDVLEVMPHLSPETLLSYLEKDNYERGHSLLISEKTEINFDRLQHALLATNKTLHYVLDRLFEQSYMSMEVLKALPQKIPEVAPDMLLAAFHSAVSKNDYSFLQDFVKKALEPKNKTRTEQLLLKVFYDKTIDSDTTVWHRMVDIGSLGNDNQHKLRYYR